MFIEHFILFGVFAYLVSLLFFRPKTLTFAFLLLGIMPVIGEVAQIWIPSNILFDYGIAHPLFFKFEAHDILYNYAGELFGLALIKLFKYLI